MMRGFSPLGQRRPLQRRHANGHGRHSGPIHVVVAICSLVIVMMAASPLADLTSATPARAAPASDMSPGDAPRAQTGTGYRVFATREGLVGGWTSSGHVITTWDYFVSLPACTTMSCPGASPGRAGMTNCGSLCYVKVINPATGACRTEPIYDVGPWFTVDDWWNPADVRFLNKLPSNRQTLPQGLPGAQAAWDGKNVGYGWGPNGIGGSDVYANVGNQAGIDLADGTYWSLGIGGVVGNWVDVEMLWQTGESPAAAAQGCGHQLLQGGGAIPRWTPTPVTPTPTVPLTSWGTAKVTGTGGSGLNCRTAPSGSGTVIAVFPEGATVTLRGPAANGWYPVVCAGQAGFASASYLATTSTPTPTKSATATRTVTATATATGTATTTPTTTATMTATPSTTATMTTTASATSSATTTGTIPATATATGSTTPITSPSVTSTSGPATLTPSTTATATAANPPSPSATVRPSVTPTTGPANWGSGTIANTGGAGVNCRTGPSTGNAVITVLGDGSRVQLTGPAANGWQPVICAGRQGYISVPYLNGVQFTPTAATSPSATPSRTPATTPSHTPTRTFTATASSTATTGATPSPSSSPGRTATATPTRGATSTPSLPNWGSGTIRNTGGAGVNCRTSPNTSASIIRAYPDGTVLQLTGPASGGWQPAVCNGKQGYISAQYLGAVPFTPTPTPTPPVSGALGVPNPSATVSASPSPSATAPATTPGSTGTPSVTLPDAQPGTIAMDPTTTSTATTEPSQVPEPSPTGMASEPDIPTASPTPVPTEETITTAYVAGTGGAGAACMAAPSWDSSLLEVIPDGAEVSQIGTPAAGWQSVICGGARGYVDAAYLSATPVTPGPEPTLPEVTDAVETVSPAGPTEPPIEEAAIQTFTFTPITETSVLRSSPDVPQAGVSGSSLSIGGPDGGMAVLSFDVAGFADGSVIQATLYVTGAGGEGSGGQVIAIPGVVVDPSSTTATSIIALGGSDAGWLDGPSPGVQSTIDVTAVVANGTVTFVLMGTDAPVAIAGTQSGSGPILVVTAASSS